MIYVTGDIHGNIPAWEDIKKQINLKKTDKLYVIGDVIDRLPGGLSIVQEIMETENMAMLTGNHELMMIRAIYNPSDDNLRLWYTNGGRVTHEEYKAMPKKKQRDIFKYIESRRYQITVDPTRNSPNPRPFILVHAAPRECFDYYSGDSERLKESTVDFMTWDRTLLDNPVDLGKPVIIGHTPTPSIKQQLGMDNDSFTILHLENDWHAIDCGAAFPDKGGVLSCLRLDDMKEFYSTSKKEE